MHLGSMVLGMTNDATQTQPFFTRHLLGRPGRAWASPLLQPRVRDLTEAAWLSRVLLDTGSPPLDEADYVAFLAQVRAILRCVCLFVMVIVIP